MSKDDVGPKRPQREEDPSYITMPPELRAYDTGPLEDTAIKPGDDPILDAAVAGIRVLDGDPNADPFYYDVRKRRSEAKKGEGAGNVAAYVAPTGVPSAAEVKAGDAAPAKVVIAELGDPLSTRAIDVRAFRGKAAVARGVTGADGDEPNVARGEAPAGDVSVKQPEAAPSPWSKEAPTPESLRASALPSSLRPRELPAPSGERPAVTAGRSRARVVLTLALVIVALGVGVLVLTSKPPESGSQPTAPTATTTAVLPAVTPPVPASSTAPAPPPPSSSSAAAPAAPVSTTAAPERPRPVPPRSSAPEDPYADAAVKLVPAVPGPPPATAAPVAPPPVTTHTQPPAPPPTPTAVLPGGDKLNL